MKKKILILVSILVVFLAIPPFVNYWVSTPSPIGFIPIEKQEVWISFYASLIGSGITLLGVALTICYTDFTKIAYVSQDNYLFDNTIRENIRMGDLNATDKQVEQAAKDCGCHEFIMALPDGYDTIVGSAGGHLSGGERQRISIARAMLKNAPIIILDEATAYTDPENEALIQHSVAKLIKGKTLIVIAHRLSTIVDADQIFVIENGTVAETGTHNELLANGEIYSNMWRAHMSVKDSEQEVEPRA